MADKHDEQLLGFSNLNKIFPIIDVVDDLNSDITNRPLSAKQGKTLKEMINGITSFNYEIVTELPAVGQKGIIYLILNSASTEENNIYDEYLYINNKYEKLGSFTTQIDLSQIKDELFFDFDIINAFNRTENESGTVKDEYYNKLLEAINNNKIIKYNEIVFNTLKYNTDDSGQSFVIELSFYSNYFGPTIIKIKNDKTFVQKTININILNVDNLNQSSWENVNEIEQNITKLVYIKFYDGTCSPSLYTDIALHNFGKVYKFIYVGFDGYLHNLGVVNPDTTTDKIQFHDEKIINYANDDVGGDILLGYQANANNYPLQVDAEHRAFINIPENKYELDADTFMQKYKGTISVDKYNEILNAIKANKSIYLLGFLVFATIADSDIIINVELFYFESYLIIDSTGNYYFVPKYIRLEYSNYGYFNTPFGYIFENKELLNYVQSINVDGDLTIIQVKDIEKTSNTVTFNLITANNYCYSCSYTSGDDIIDITGSYYIYATNNKPGIIRLGYTQNDKNYPLQLDEDGKAFVNVPWSGSTYNNATQTADGLMSKEDKIKLDGFTGSTTKILTQSEYDGLTNKDENTIYFIKG